MTDLPNAPGLWRREGETFYAEYTLRQKTGTAYDIEYALKWHKFTTDKGTTGLGGWVEDLPKGNWQQATFDGERAEATEEITVADLLEIVKRGWSDHVIGKIKKNKRKLELKITRLTAELAAVKRERDELRGA